MCYYEILHKSAEAIDLARTAFDTAMSAMTTDRAGVTEDPTYQDSALIMQLLRDNLTLWMAGQLLSVCFELLPLPHLPF